MASLKALPSSPKAYQMAFGVFLQHSTAREAIIECITKFGSLAVVKWSNNNYDLDKAVRVLGVGSGTGKSDFLFLETIAAQLQEQDNQENFKKVEMLTRVVEPNSSELSIFMTSVSTALPPTLAKRANVSFEWELAKFQDYSSQINQAKNFDFIHFVHSLYYMDADTTLKHCYHKELGESGVIFCLVQTARSYFPQMMRKFQDKLKFGPDDVFFYTTDELVVLVEKYKWSYEYKSFPFKVDITKCLDKSCQEGSLLLDFVTHQENFRDKADAKLLQV